MLPESNSLTVNAEVIAVGEGSRFMNGDLLPIKVKKGDRICLERNVGLPIRIEGEDFQLIREGDIVGVFEEVKVKVKAVK